MIGSIIPKKLRKRLKMIGEPQYDIPVPFVRDFPKERKLVREALESFDYDTVIAIAKVVPELSTIPGYTDRDEMRKSIESTAWAALDDLAKGEFIEYIVGSGNTLYVSRISGQYDVEVWYNPSVEDKEDRGRYGISIKFAPVEFMQ